MRQKDILFLPLSSVPWDLRCTHLPPCWTEVSHMLGVQRRQGEERAAESWDKSGELCHLGEWESGQRAALQQCSQSNDWTCCFWVLTLPVCCGVGGGKTGMRDQPNRELKKAVRTELRSPPHPHLPIHRALRGVRYFSAMDWTIFHEAVATSARCPARSIEQGKKHPDPEGGSSGETRPNCRERGIFYWKHKVLSLGSGMDPERPRSSRRTLCPCWPWMGLLVDGGSVWTLSQGSSRWEKGWRGGEGPVEELKRLGAGDRVRPSLSRTGSGFSPGCGSSSASIIQVLSTRRSLEGRTQSWLVSGVASGCSSADSRLPWGQASRISWQQ